jgi:hypothetical protein
MAMSRGTAAGSPWRTCNGLPAGPRRADVRSWGVAGIRRAQSGGAEGTVLAARRRLALRVGQRVTSGRPGIGGKSRTWRAAANCARSACVSSSGSRPHASRHRIFLPLQVNHAMVLGPPNCPAVARHPTKLGAVRRARPGVRLLGRRQRRSRSSRLRLRREGWPADREHRGVSEGLPVVGHAFVPHHVVAGLLEHDGLAAAFAGLVR